MHAAVRQTALLLAMPLFVAGCASSSVDAQWKNVEVPPAYLRGATVLVSCETGDDVLRRICQDQVSADLSSRGAMPVFAEPGTVAVYQPGIADAQYLPAARSLAAKAVLSVTVGASSAAVSQGMAVSIGGFGFGSHSAGGLGVTAPIGGGQLSNGYSANGRVTDVASGKLMWTARANTPPSGDVNGQMGELSRSVLDAAGKAGLF
jgi:hypothetical protein